MAQSPFMKYRIKKFIHDTYLSIRAQVLYPFYRYPHRIIFIASLPKSGSEWLNHLLFQIPGYGRVVFADPDGVTGRHAIDHSVFSTVPKRGYFVFKTHTEASPESLSAIRDLELRVIVMWRDPRDQAVSRYYHVLNDPGHPHAKIYAELSEEAGISHSVDVVLSEFIPWIENWRKAIQENPDKFLVTTYEKLRTDTEDTLRKILTFYSIDAEPLDLKRMIATADKNTKRGGSLRERLEKRVTFRSGETGGWRKYLTDRDVALFKRDAGDLLVELGYEASHEWGLTSPS